MLVPIKWLKDFVNIDDISIKELQDKLVSCGFEIEGVNDLSKDIRNVVVGRIEAIEKHPNADKLQVCKLNVGKDTALQIVTGAKNVKVGDYVPVALDNSYLPCKKEIFKGELRGVISEGMLVGGSEFNMTDEDYPNASVDGILIFEEGLTLGQDINEVFGTNEIVLDIGITANRIDANSIYGIAREVAAVLNRPLKPLKLDYNVIKDDVNKYVSVENLETTLCPRYMAAAACDIKVEKSPKIIKDRLKAVGIRSINNIVDITNYVLIEVGQPMHAFDTDMIKGSKIIVRVANQNEKILALDDKEYTLSEKNLVIANTEEAMAVAGVMGGKNYSIFDTTKTIILESARFKRDNVRRTTKQINLHSDSSARFGKGVDFYSQETGLKRALSLIDEYKFGKIIDGVVDNFPVKPVEKVITFTSKEIENILGIAIPDNEILRILNGLTLETKLNNKIFETKIPLYREDMSMVNDIAEELIRIFGYKFITPTLIKDGTMQKGGKSEEQKTLDKIKNILIAKGAYEILTYSFVSPKIFDYLHIPENNPLRNTIKLSNPLGEDFSIMRTTLAHSMLKAISTNFQRGNKELLLFEVAKTYKKGADLTTYPIEENVLALGSLGQDFYSFKAAICDLLSVLRIDARFVEDEIPYLQKGRTAKIVSSDGKVYGYLGEADRSVLNEYNIDQRAYIAELNIETLISLAKNVLPFKVISKYPFVERDLALIAAKSLKADEILDSVKASIKTDLKSVSIFDVYEGGQIEAGFKSVAIKLIFQSDEKTLKDTDVNEMIEKILKDLEIIKVKLR